jgi:thiamine-phosphate pyrophosphorylase
MRELCAGHVVLYALITEQYCRRPWLETAEAVLAGGAGVIQLREKDLGAGELLERGRALRSLTEGYGVLLIINDRPDVALLSGADGVHLGQGDLPAPAVRELVGPDVLIGLTTHTVEEAAAAEALGVDYVGVGPAYPTRTKDIEHGGGPELIRRLCRATRLPGVAIGGVTPSNAAPLVVAGARAVAACAALCAAENPEQTARAFVRAIREAEGPHG